MYWIGGVVAFVGLYIGVEYIFEKSFLDRYNYSFTTELMLGLLIWISKIAYSTWEKDADVPADKTKKESILFSVLSVVGLLMALCKFGNLVFINRYSNHRNLLVYTGIPFIITTVQALTGLSTGVGWAVFIGSLLLCTLWKDGEPDSASSAEKASLSMIPLVSGIVTSLLVYNEGYQSSDNLPYYIGLLVLLGLMWLLFRKAVENIQLKYITKKLRPLGVLLFLFLAFPFFVLFLAAISGGLVLLLLLLYLLWKAISDMLSYFLAPRFFHYGLNLAFGMVALSLIVWMSKNIWKIVCGDDDQMEEMEEKDSM